MMDFATKVGHSEYVDIPELERELCRIPDVRATRIVTNADGRPVEVHVLATEGKHAKQLARDVQSVAIASFGLTLDHRIISVVQLGDGLTQENLPQNGHARQDLPADHDDHLLSIPPSQRVNIEAVSATKSGLENLASVTLSRGGREVSGESRSSVATSAVLRSIAQATLLALRQLEPAATRVDIEMASILRYGDRAIAVTSVVMVTPPFEEVVSGSAIVRSGGDHEAVARAVLDATNRRLRQLTD